MVKQKLRNLITDPETGELISLDSGQVVSEGALSLEPEWRSFDAGEANDRSRAGVPTSLARHDMGLSTVIGRTDRDAGGNTIDSDMRFRMERLKKWDNRSQRHSPSERNLQQAFSMLAKIKERMGLPDVDEQRCIGCALCVEICTALGPDVLRVKPVEGWKRGKAFVFYPERCISDGACVGVCPTHAIFWMRPMEYTPGQPVPLHKNGVCSKGWEEG